MPSVPCTGQRLTGSVGTFPEYLIVIVRDQIQTGPEKDINAQAGP